MLHDFLSLVFPKVCYACGKSLFRKEDCICMHCLYRLPKTHFHLYGDNPVMRLFWGRVDIFSASSLYSFGRESRVQKLIHQLKYKGKKEIGHVLGKYYGRELKSSWLFSSVNMVVPVPLHKKKQKRRGYNQSEAFAAGLAESMKTDVAEDALIRMFSSESQTRKSRFARWKNTEEVFRINSAEKMQGKHVLLVDDVVTTGSTLEACAGKVLEIQGTRVSAVTIAYTAL